MDSGFDYGAYKAVMILLATAGLVVPLLLRLNISSILAYLMVGALLGPHGLGAFPTLHILTIGAQDHVGQIAEFGVVFLLFLIGLELSPERLFTMRRLVFGLGALQMVATTLSIGYAALLWGATPAAGLIIGAALALSSTAIIVELLAGQGRLSSATGRASFAILLFQDVSVVPVLFLVGILGGHKDGSIVLGLVRALAQGGITVFAIIVLGRSLFQPFFRLVSVTKNHELFIAATLFVIVGISLLGAVAGLSMAFGAFIAGLVLGETEYRRAIAAEIEPFKGLLLGIFFFTVGMSLDFATMLAYPLQLLAAVLALIALKTAILALSARVFRLSWSTGLKTGLILGSGGEFGFVILNQALDDKLISIPSAGFILSLIALSMAVIPLSDALGQWLTRRFNPVVPAPELSLAPPDDNDIRAVIVGYGRVGQMVGALMDTHKIKYIATDRDTKIVTKWRRAGQPIYFGDARQEKFLRHCHIDTASALIITIHAPEEIDAIVRAAHAIRPDLVIVSRAQDAQHASHLYEIGVTDAVPETIEASLQLSEAALVGLGVATGYVIASIHEKRDELRRQLQGAASKVGRVSRGIKAPRSAKP